VVLGAVRDFVVDSESGSITHVIVTSGGLGSIGATLRRIPYSDLRFERDVNDRAKLWGDLTGPEFARLPTISAEAFAQYSAKAVAACVAERRARSEVPGREVGSFELREVAVRATSLMLVSELVDLEVRARAGSSAESDTAIASRALGSLDEIWLECTTGRVAYASLLHEGRRVVLPVSALSTLVDLERRQLFVASTCSSELLARAPALELEGEQTLANEAFRQRVAWFYGVRSAAGSMSTARASHDRWRVERQR
jgi:hypothetical protein